MIEKIKETIGLAVSLTALIGIPAMSIAPLIEDCETVEVPYSIEERHESKARSDYNPEKAITQHGRTGETKKCVKKFGGETREEVISEPVKEIITYYDYYEPYNSYTPSNSFNTYKAAPASDGVRTGAMCNDGTTSSATGRGACSRHGGVNYWLTN